MRRTNICAWTENWENLYSQEEAVLKDIFKDELIGIFHIGSTSIRAVGYAKPIIDILIVVKDIEKVDLYNSDMFVLGYEAKGEYGIAARRYFSKGKSDRTHHVHIFQIGNEHIKTHLAFKEYLIENPAEAKRYGELKINLAKQFPNEHHEYQTGKQQLVNELAEKAKKWALCRSFPTDVLE
ncbi:GrpB family protein [Metabacillus fastidiosus]|uniref:GrpB family protein n=1 Tax=Metabacillus fastidiosus TaxID=1458 RepID=A0ABU6P4N9_9BACI|nr:GrpB family protein [Metabacillus fastidiosus]MED4404035.1 GrpB family protein [Metabacillus fastidiosus]MED4462738.1 GrpB family protein [Metabacillus fastidiosus]